MIESPFRLLVGTKRGQRAWLVGSGPSLDVVPWKDIPKDDHIFCLNASIIIFLDIGKFPNAWWLYRDRRICNEIGDRLNPWKRFKILTTRKGFYQARDTRLLRQKNAAIHIFDENTLIHERTVAEDALQLVHAMGFYEVNLVGIDHCVVQGKPYAKMLSWKQCYFYGRKEENPPERHSIRAMVDAMKGIKNHIEGLDVFNTSPFYPEEVFPYRSIEDALACRTVHRS